MSVRIDKPPGLGDRIRDRHHRANEYLEGAPAPKQIWGRAHLYAADVADVCVSCVNNKFTSTLTGTGSGIAKGLIIGAFIAFGVATFFPFLSIPALAGASVLGAEMGAWVSTFMITTGVSAAVYGAKGAIEGYQDGLRDDAITKGGKIAEKICKHGHAIGDKVPKEFDKAAQRILTRKGYQPPPPPHPEEPENKRFVEALEKSRELESGERVR
jgi:hypothetical protein